MKATLTFSLPDEQEAFNDAVKGSDWHALVNDLDDALRQKVKYEDDESYQPFRDMLHELLGQYDLDF